MAAILAILAFGLLLRVYSIDLPLLEFYPTRQVQTAEVTRNLYRDDFKILEPSVGYFGGDQTLFLLEFPLYNLAVATLYALAGGVREYLGRIFSIIGFVVSFFFLWGIAKKYVGQIPTLVALFFYSFSPLSVLVSRSFQPDQWTITLSLATMYSLDKWTRRSRSHLFLISAIFASLTLLLKAPAAIFTLIPACYLLYSSGKKRLMRALTWLTVSVLPSVAWYLYAWSKDKVGVVPEGNFSLFNWFSPQLFFDPKFYSTFFGYEYNIVLLPVGMILFLIGLATKIRKSQSLLYWWLAGIILYFAIFNVPAVAHEYYHLPFLPIASIFIGIGAEKIINSLKNLIIPKNLFLVSSLLFLIILMLPPILERAYGPIERFNHVVLVGNIIQTLSAPEDLIIGSMDGGPTLVYYSDRNGWSMRTNRRSAEEVITELENLKEKGAVIFASAQKSQFLDNIGFSDYMYANFKTLVETGDYVIFDLRKPPL